MRQLYDPVGGHPALDLVNVLNRTAGEPPVETLLEYADLVLWARQAGHVSPSRAGELAREGERRPSESRAVLARARSLREAIFDVFTAFVHDEEPPPAGIATINSELARALAHARIERTGDGFAWTWSPTAESLDEPLWPIARATADLLVSPERALVKQCASERCLWLFLDATKNHRRRWCEMKTCGNRAKVRQHRRRERDSGDAQ